MCDFSSNCKNKATYSILTKWNQKTQQACAECAGKIGARSEAGPVMLQRNSESQFYKITALR